MADHMRQRANEEEEGADKSAAELTEDTLEEVAGGQTTCVPKEPIIDTIFPLPYPTPIDRPL